MNGLKKKPEGNVVDLQMADLPSPSTSISLFSVEPIFRGMKLY